MKDDTHDDQPLTFTQLGLPTALILNRMRNGIAMRELVNEQQEKTGKNQRKTSADDEQQILKDLSELNRRLAALRRWRGLDKNTV